MSRLEKNAFFLSSGVGSDEAHPLSRCCQGMLIAVYPIDAFYSSKKVQTRCEVLFRVIVALTGEWAVKPRGRRFMDPLVLSRGERSGMHDVVSTSTFDCRRRTLNCETCWV